MIKFKLGTIVFLLACLAVITNAQVDTLQSVPADTSEVVPEVHDTIPPAPLQDTIPETKTKKDRKPYDKFKIGAGVSVGKVDAVQSYSSEDRLGYVFSFAYQRGRFFY